MLGLSTAEGFGNEQPLVEIMEDSQMKKISVLTLALLLALFLTACNNDVPSSGYVPNSSVPVVASSEVPNNGPTPTVSAPFEVHPGDKGYFYVRSPDYLLYMCDLEEIRDLGGKNYVSEYGRATYYCMNFYYWEPYGGEEYVEKRVFENNTYAEQYAAARKQENADLNLIVVENVVYLTDVLFTSPTSKVDTVVYWRCHGAYFAVSGNRP